MKCATFLTQKCAEIGQFSGKLVNFPREKGRFGFLIRSLHFGSNRLCERTPLKCVRIGSGYSSIKDKLRSCVAFLTKEKGSALSFYQKLVSNIQDQCF